MTSPEEYEAGIKAAEQELGQAKTADEIRETWRKYNTLLGHRTLGRLLLGRSAVELLDRRADRG